MTGYDSFGYNLTLFIHILGMIVAFAPTFVWPFVSANLRKNGEDGVGTVARLSGGATAKIYGPALVVGGVFGFGVVGMSKGDLEEGIFQFSDAFVSAGMLVWFLLLGVYFGLMAPAEKRVLAGDEGAKKLLSMSSGLVHLLAAIALIVMIWKPGWGA